MTITFAPSTKAALWTVAQVLVFLLLLVWPVPGTIALRHSLLALLMPLVAFIWWARPDRGESVQKYWAPPCLLAMLTLWMMAVILVWGVEPRLSWAEFGGQWLKALGVGLIAWLLSDAASVETETRVKSLAMTLFWALLTLVLLHNLLDAIYWYSTGNLPFRKSPVMSMPVFLMTWPLELHNAFSIQSPDKMSYATNLLAAIVVAEVAQRLTQHKRWLTCSNAVLLFAVAAVLLGSYWLRMRNGNVGLLMLLTVTVFMLAIRLKRRFGSLRVLVVALAMLAGLGALAAAMVNSDERWLKLEQTIPIAWDTQTYHAWMTQDDYPLMPNGELVDMSAYERLAWAKESGKLVIDHPMGTGYNRNAFGDNIDRKYQRQGKSRGSHAHTDIIDFTVANGVIGTAIWLAFLGSLFVVGWSAFQKGQVTLGLSLMFLVTGFTSRSVVDSNIRDDALQQFFFLAMFFYGLAVKNSQKQHR